ncbi:MAG TPA: CDP-diacylglycerol--serine O-phosphatidyltransferase [Candidatus Woesearchaeota archaeon]|jgi:CDP-diacylglycerol--serine O-phosphatidyltransferase|nr:CDP-diacylglycerol--serine O-phosphatidyltransferase [Candidatus Woesearchaeota archaeon]HJN56518.1 CDP-diacylglycerol--serine O-phosphatidyltransferase [Candidatus Woesearchaeota archaeon]|tara:strand:- start:8811 stop:9842 length:1032 start_codon:yes stop_codon:yes gene_type:complete
MKLKIKEKKFPISIALFRILLAFILFFVILSGIEEISVFLFIITAFLSFFGQFIQKQKSQLKSILDLIADKLLVNLAAIALVMVGLIPLWVMLVFLGRDLLTIAGGSYLFYKDIRREFKPTHIGKITSFSQVIALIPAIFGELDWVLIFAAVILTVMSAVELIFKSEFRLTRKSDISEFRISRLLKIADILTLMNVVFGVMVIFFAINKSYKWAVIFLFLAVIADFFDGKVARKLGQENVFGKELDSLADTISFGVAPTIFGFSLIQSPLAIVAFTIFLFCGILRLARYNIMDSKDGYAGMPITLNGLIVPVIYLAKVPLDFYPYIYIILGVLMISNIKFRKI